MGYPVARTKSLTTKELWELFRKRNLAAKNVADLWSSLLEACYYYAVPYRNRFYRPKEQQGEFKATRVYDTTGVEATKTFVSKIHDAMTPPQTQWGFLDIDLNFNDLEEVEQIEMQQHLNNYMRKLFIYIHESNFDVVINECYFDLAIGTACLVINSYTDKQPLLFTSVPMDKLSIEEAMTGRVESWFRDWDNTKINEICVRWPKAKLTDEMMMMVMENPDSTVMKLYEGVMYMPHMKKPYYYMLGTAEDWLLCEPLESNPGIVWRFQKVNDEVFGRGPVMDALPSMISLNELARIELASANLNVFRPYMGFSDAVFNPHTFRLEPFTVIPIAPIVTGGSPPLIPLPNSASPEFAQLTIMDLRNQIKTLLFNDIQQMQSRQPETATAAVIDRQSLAERIGPLFSRLQQEFAWPLIERCAYILDKRGMLKRPKFTSKKGEDVKIIFRYKSPLALAKGTQDIARFTQYYQLMQGMFGPDAAAIYVNPGIAPYLIAEQMQVDMRYLNNAEAVAAAAQGLQDQQDATNDAMAAQQQQELQMQQAQTQKQQQQLAQQQ